MSSGPRPAAPEATRPSGAEPFAHAVQFYEDDGALADAVARYLAPPLRGGEGAVVVATLPHREAVGERLRGEGVDVASLETSGRYVPLDADETLRRFLRDGAPDAARFERVVGGVIDRVGEGGRPVAVYGEMVATLWADARRDAALRLERLWNDLARTRSFSLLCGYPLRAFGAASDRAALAHVCREHSEVRPTERYAALATDAERDRMVVELQQKALALDREVAHRRDLEESLRRRERELSEVLEESLDGVVDLDATGRVRWANRAFLDAVGVPAEACLGRPVEERLATPGLFDRLWARCVAGQAPGEVAASLRRDDRGVREVLVRTSRLRVVGGEVHMRWFLRTPGAAPLGRPR